MHQCYLQCKSSPFSFLDTYSLSMSSLECKVLCIVNSFLFSGSFVEVLPSSISKWSQVSYKENSAGVYTFDEIPWSQEIFSFAWGTLFFFNFFLSSPLVWCCPLPIYPSTCRFPFLRSVLTFSWFVNSVSFVICLFIWLIWKLYPSSLADVFFSLEFEWQQVSSSF